MGWYSSELLYLQVLCHLELPSVTTLLASQYPLCSVTVEEEKCIEDAGSRTLPVSNKRGMML